MPAAHTAYDVGIAPHGRDDPHLLAETRRVYAEHVVLALEAIRGMALSVLLQPHLLASHRERILRACRDLAQQTQTDVEDDVVVVTDVPDGAPSCQNPLV